jgi:hypothetical protein
MKLGVLIPFIRANTYYRAIFPMQALEQRGHSVVWPKDVSRQVALRELAACDLVHCYRSWDRLGDLETLARRGVAISFDNDDNLGASDLVGARSSLQGRMENRHWSRTYERMARLADLVTTPSEELAAKYRKAGAREVVVIENYLDHRMQCFGHSSRHHGVVVGWIAGAEHSKDVSALKLTESLSRLLDAHADLRLITVGVRLPLHSARYEYVQKVSYLDLLKVVSGIDIGIAPLLDSDFNRCRSNVKLKEYGAGSAAWVASPVGPYRGLGAKQGGILVEDGDWFDALDRLVRSRITRSRLARRALRWAKTQTVDRHAAEWEKQLLLAVERAEARTGASAAI